MGSSARMSRSERFVAEFGEDICLQSGLSELPGFHSQHLSMRDSDEMVYLYVAIHWKDAEHELMLDCIYFDPEESDEDAIERVTELLGVEANEAEERLIKAELIESHPCKFCSKLVSNGYHHQGEPICSDCWDERLRDERLRTTE